MNPICTVLTSFFYLASTAAAQPGVPPTFKTVASVDKEKGQIVFAYTVVKSVPQEVEVVIIKDGQVFKERQTRYTYISEQRLSAIDASKSRVITPDGKQLPIDEVWKRLKPSTVVVVSADGNTPAQAYLQALNPATLVIIPPPIIPPPPQPKQ